MSTGWILIDGPWSSNQIRELGMQLGELDTDGQSWLNRLVSDEALAELDPHWGTFVWGLHPRNANGTLNLSVIAANLQDTHHLFLRAEPLPGYPHGFAGRGEYEGLKDAAWLTGLSPH